MDGIGNDGGITSKLNTLLRMGLVSRNNVRRAQFLFQNPEKAMKNPAYRLLMQEILMDVVDRVLNNRQLYTVLRQTISKEPNLTTESVQGERMKTLLRSGLVKKKNMLAARRALESNANAMQMSAVKVYREMMIDMMDTMVSKITGSPVLFNAFKRTMGKQEVEESFEVPTQESLEEFFYMEDVQTLMEKNKPTNPSLWAKMKAAAKKKFDVYPSAYANGWAVKQYNEKGGGWKSVSEGKTFFNFMDELDEEITPARQAVIDREKEKASKALNKGKTAKERDRGYARGSRINYLELVHKYGRKSDKEGSPYQVNKRELNKWRKAEHSMREGWEGSPAQSKLKKAKADYAKHSAEMSKPVPPTKGSTNPMARQDTKSGKMYWAADRRKKSGTGTKRASDADYRSDTTSE